jgi:hypothetical protein
MPQATRGINDTSKFDEHAAAGVLGTLVESARSFPSTIRPIPSAEHVDPGDWFVKTIPDPSRTCAPSRI